MSHSKPIGIITKEAFQRAGGFQFKSNDLVGLFTEVTQLAKLHATEKRDLEAIQADFAIKMSEIEAIREATVTGIQGEYQMRNKIVDYINDRIKQLIDKDKYEEADKAMQRMMDILADSPLQKALDAQLSRRLGKS